MAEVHQLPVFRTIDRAYWASLINLGYYLRVSWAWLALTTIAFTLVNAAIDLAFPKSGGDDLGISEIVSGIAELLVPIPLIASTAVAWHRFMVEGKRVGETVYLDAGPTVRRYAGVALIFLVCTIAPVLPLFVVSLLPSPLMAKDGSLTLVGILGVLALLVVWIIGQIISVRLSLWLPAIALERDEATAAWAWEGARKNTWRMCIGCLLCWAPAATLMSLVPEWTTTGGGPLVDAVLQAVRSVLSVVVIGLPTLTFLSLAYRRLVLGLM